MVSKVQPSVESSQPQKPEREPSFLEQLICSIYAQVVRCVSFQRPQSSERDLSDDSFVLLNGDFSEETVNIHLHQESDHQLVANNDLADGLSRSEEITTKPCPQVSDVQTHTLGEHLQETLFPDAQSLVTFVQGGNPKADIPIRLENGSVVLVARTFQVDLERQSEGQRYWLNGVEFSIEVGEEKGYFVQRFTEELFKLANRDQTITLNISEIANQRAPILISGGLIKKLIDEKTQVRDVVTEGTFPLPAEVTPIFSDYKTELHIELNPSVLQVKSILQGRISRFVGEGLTLLDLEKEYSFRGEALFDLLSMTSKIDISFE